MLRTPWVVSCWMTSRSTIGSGCSREGQELCAVCKELGLKELVCEPTPRRHLLGPVH